MVAATSVQINRNSAVAHLEALGYQRGDTVFVRYIRPTDKKSIKTKGLDFTEANRYQSQGYDVYFVVNGGGDTDNDVIHGRAVFYEHDNLDKEIQLYLWESLGLPEPTFQVDTGGKSIHSYWVFDEPIPIEQWRELQSDLLEFSDGDRNIKNPSRILRLAGSYYMKGDNPGQKIAEIISNSGKRYSYSELRAVIPKQAPPSFEPRETTNINCGNIPLYQCLTKHDRALIDSGVGEGSRNNSGAKLARNLIGTAERLTYLGYSYDGDARQLFDAYCQKCTPALTSKEADIIWRSALKDNPTATLTDNALENCVQAWQRNQVKATGKSFGGDNLQRTTQSTTYTLDKSSDSNERLRPVVLLPEVDINAVKAEIIKVLTEGASTTDIAAAKIKIRQKYPSLATQELNRLWSALAAEFDLSDSRDFHFQQVQQLIEARNSKLNICDYIHPSIALPLQRIADWMCVDVEAMLTILLPSAASLLNPNSQIIVKECIDFVEPFIFYSGIVAPSGSRKSPIFRHITKPLKQLQEQEDERYKEALEEYQDACTKWEKNGKDGEKPTPPPPIREFYVDNVTGEALDRIKTNQPNHGMLLRKDELSGLFGSLNVYRGGKGADKEGLLSGWGGDGVKVNRAGGSRLHLARDAMSIAGGIQPGKLKKLMGDLEDEQGDWARFIWYYAKEREAYLPDGDARFDLGELLTHVYRQLDKLPVLTLRFAPDAQKIYQDWYRELDRMKRAETRNGMKAAIAKFAGYTARFAGILHVLWEIVDNVGAVSSTIPVERMTAAINLAKFYLKQVHLILGEGEIEFGELSPILAKLLEKARLLGELNTRTAKNSIRMLRNVDTSKILAYFKELEKMDYGKVTGKKFVPFLQNVDSVDNPVDGMLTPDVSGETLIPQSIQHFKKGNVDNVDNVDVFRKEQTNAQQTTEPVMGVDTSFECQHRQHLSADSLESPNLLDVDSVDASINTASTRVEPESLHPLPDNNVDAISSMSTSPTSPSPNDQDAVMGNAELIRECITEMDWEMISVLTEQWTEEFKKAVWALLTAPERAAVKALSPKCSIVKSGEALNKGDYVEVLVGKCKGKRALVSSMDEGGVWLKELKGALLIDGCPYQPHQLKRTTAD